MALNVRMPDGTPNAGPAHDRIPADSVSFFGVNPRDVDRLTVI